MNRLSRVAVLGTTAFAMLLLTHGSVLAQAQEEETEEIVVVGSRGEARDPMESAVPVDVISADEIAAAHSFGGELGELLQALAPSFSFPRQSNSGAGDHVRAAQLRGMSPDHTLVLVNGKRQHTASVVALESAIGLGTNPFDFNTIPLIAIERIEILRDGAGAQYGSDAIAGVINIVLKDAAQGATVTASYGSHRTDFGPTSSSISDGDTFSVAADYGFAVGDGGSLRIGGEYRTRDATNRAGIGVLPFFEDDTPANQALNPARVFAPGDGGADDIYVFYNATVPVGEREFYSFGRYSNRETEGTGFFRYPDGFSSLPSVHPNGFRPITLGDNTDTSLSVGLRGTNFQSDWDLSLTLGSNDFDSGVKDSANPSLGAASPTSFNLGGFEFTQMTLNADVVKEFELDGLSSPLTIAYGAEVRFEDYETSAGDPESYEAGPNDAAVGAQAGPGLAAGTEANVDRTVISAYVDVEADLTDRFTIGGAARFEDYDDFGNSLTGKLSGRFQATDTFAIRGAVGTSFRAPSLAQIGFEKSKTDFGDGGMLELFRILPVSNPDAIAEGAVPLKEEESTNFSVGFVFDSGPAFTLTVDYFQIDVDDRVTLINAANNIEYFSNLIDTETTGFDVVVAGVIEVGAGTFDWSVSYNNSDTDAKNPSVLDVEDLNTVESKSPEDKFIASGNWIVDRWSVLLRLTQYGETTRVFDFGGGFEPTQTYGSVWSVDADFAAKINDDWTVAIGADNLTDEYPDRSSDDINYFGHLPYDVLSGIGMNGRYFYLRTQYDF
ncbi:MAG: TonB-dependent receptor [Gammaproteobacteria bacterium]|nr:TonB-dependent receptor [Gammaproteobacteria bacterium]MDH3410113.1 TonB-dependent receptor [Gammaproteobacteria bacterium]